MDLRRLLVAGAVLAALVPTSAQADHCDIPIYLFSSTRVQTDVEDPDGNPVGRSASGPASSAAACLPWDEIKGDVGPDGHDAFDSDIIYPGSNRLSVRLFDQGSDPVVIKSATLTFTGVVYPLDLQASLDVTGAAAPWLDSKPITIDPASSITGGDAVISICMTYDLCVTRTYRTVA